MTLPDLPSLAFVERAGGWRHFMRVATEVPRGLTAGLDRTTVRRFPQAVLGFIFVEAKGGDLAGARRDYDRWQPTLERLAAGNTSLAADLILVDLHLSVYEDRPFTADSVQRLAQARAWLADDDLTGQALAGNQLCNIALQMGDFDLAQHHAEQAIRLYHQGDAVFGALHLHTHLAQIRLMRGDLLGAGDVLQTMEARLAKLPGEAQWLIAVARILRAEVAYEANDLDEARRLRGAAFDLVEHRDAWFDILTTAYRVNTRLAYAESGLPGALEALSHAERIAHDRHMPRLHRLMQVERLRALTLSDETRTALRLRTEIGLSTDRATLEESDDLAYRQGTTFVAVARLLVRTRRPREALAFIALAEDLAIRRGQLLALAKLRVIAASAHWSLGFPGEATASLLSAIRLLGDQPFSRFILDEGAGMRSIVQAALHGHHTPVPPTGAQRERLSRMMHYWATRGRSPGGRQRNPASDLHRRYLELLSLGHTNKEIARVMGVSDNTVKYHLRQIFRELDASNRGRAVQRARDLGLIRW